MARVVRSDGRVVILDYEDRAPDAEGAQQRSVAGFVDPRIDEHAAEGIDRGADDRRKWKAIPGSRAGSARRRSPGS